MAIKIRSQTRTPLRVKEERALLLMTQGEKVSPCGLPGHMANSHGGDSHPGKRARPGWVQAVLGAVPGLQ